MVYLKQVEGCMKIGITEIKDLFKRRDKDANKYDFGVVGVMGGSLSFSGAIKLASMSALAMRSGAGIVRVIVGKNIANLVAPYLLEQTLFALDGNLHKALEHLDCLAVGMGWGISEENKNNLEYILNNYTGKLIIDADALNILASNLDVLKNTKAQVVLTPHLKEFSRLIKKDDLGGIDERKQEVRKFAKEYGVIVLLKGCVTIISDGTITYLVEAGDPGMATAGSGDVLSGILAGFLGYNSYSPLSVAAAAFMAGLAGALASKEYTDIAMVASDTIKYIPEAIKIIRGEV